MKTGPGAGGATIIGGGGADRAELDRALARAPFLIAADGAADQLAEWGVRPDAIVGDMDSLADPAVWEARPDVRLMRLEEQDTTDLEKCLYASEAEFYLGVGFHGRRLDHTLAATHTLLRYPGKRLVLLGAHDVTFLAPPEWRARLAPGAVVSIFPLRPVTGLASEGLRWPVEALALEAGGRIGTSNTAVSAEVSVRFDRLGAAITLETRFLDSALESLGVVGAATRAGAGS